MKDTKKDVTAFAPFHLEDCADQIPSVHADANDSGPTTDAWPEKKTGNIVWEMDLPAGVSNPPMTYIVNGKQYILVAVSGRQ